MNPFDEARQAVDELGDGARHVVEEGKRTAGGLVEEGSRWAADRADEAGWHQPATVLRAGGDAAANRLGADVGEWELEQTSEPAKLVHGSAEKLSATAKHLRDFQRAFEKVASGIRSLDTEGFSGRAADAFREKLRMHPAKWAHAADACEKAAGSLEDFAHTVRWAQGEAKEAVATYWKGKADSAAHHKQVAHYEAAADAYNAAVKAGKEPGEKPTKPGETDPGAGAIAEAKAQLARARRQRDEAGRRAASMVRAAVEHAPRQPEFTDRLGAEVMDEAEAAPMKLTHVAGGAVKGLTELNNFARSINPTDVYNITHPANYVTHLNSTAAGLVMTANHPDQLASSLVGDGWGKDPYEAGGRLLPDVAAAVATDGGSSAATAGARVAARTAARGAERGAARAAERGAERGAGNAARRDLEHLGEREPAREPHARESQGTDPVDLATGKMYLQQTDLALPGTLPLIFQRRVESSYRCGRWFGPSWASTADTRLEIDAEGVVFVTGDGLLLSYPHPGAGEPVWPREGRRRWPLEHTGGGDYRVTDPEAGQVWHFTTLPTTGPDGVEVAVLVQIDDRSGNWITLEHDAHGAPLTLAHCGGYELRLTTADGRITELRLAGAAADGGEVVVARYGYDAAGNLASVTGASGGTLSFEYDDRRRITAWVDSNDKRYDYFYDDVDRVVAEGTDEGYYTVDITYDGDTGIPGHRLTTVTTGAGHHTRLLVNDAHQVVARTDPLGQTTRTTYDPYDRPLQVTDPLGRTTSYTYDETGRPTTVTRPDGHYTTAEYDTAGLPTQVTHPDGAQQRYEHDAFGNRVAVTDPAGATTRCTYDERGHLTGVTDPLGATTRVRCDAAGLPVQVTDPTGATTCYVRDAFGRPTTLTDPLGQATHLEWTLDGRLARRTTPDGATESWTYDGEGNRTSHTDPLGAVSRYEYGHFDLLAARTGPDGARYAFTYDPELRLTEVTNPQGLTWSYSYDPAGRLVSETDFDDRRVAYAHDAVGQLTSRTTAAGDVLRYERDTLGRLVRKDAAGAVTSYAYDVIGGLTEVIGPDATVTIGRDAAGRPISETVNGRRLTRSYDPVGRPTGRTTPTGATRTWTYDAAGNPAELTTAGRTLTFTHDQAGRETSRHVGDSLTLSSTYDPLGRLTSQDLFDPADDRIQGRAYTYRPDGHLTAMADELNGSRSFSLDPAGRVTTVNAADWTETYAYDAAGNQTHAAWPTAMPGQAAVGERTYTGTRIRTAGNVRYEHDTAGRITLRQKTRLSRKPDTWHYEWDAEDHLRQVTTPDGTVWRYQYDPLGRRLTKQRLAPRSDRVTLADLAAGSEGEEVAEQTDFTWDGTTLAEQTTHTPNAADPSIVVTWDHDNLHPLTQTERKISVTELATADQDEIDSRFFAIITDLVGTARELVDEHGDIAWRTRTTLWGTTTWHRSSTAYTPLRFPGQYFDPETGLHYNHHRHYDPETARYLTPDPLGLTPADNPATYVHNPCTWTDPLGLAPYNARELGLSSDATSALKRLENIKQDPVGEINRDPGHNHYSAARREALGETVAEKSPGVPYDHIRDLTQAKNGLERVRKVLWKEIESPPESASRRGLEVLMSKHQETVYHLDRLKGFLHQVQKMD